MTKENIIFLIFTFIKYKFQKKGIFFISGLIQKSKN
jgi:hypothetical protein